MVLRFYDANERMKRREAKRKTQTWDPNENEINFGKSFVCVSREKRTRRRSRSPEGIQIPFFSLHLKYSLTISPFFVRFLNQEQEQKSSSLLPKTKKNTTSGRLVRVMYDTLVVHKTHLKIALPTLDLGVIPFILIPG